MTFVEEIKIKTTIYRRLQ